MKWKSFTKIFIIDQKAELYIDNNFKIIHKIINQIQFIQFHQIEIKKNDIL